MRIKPFARVSLIALLISSAPDIAAQDFERMVNGVPAERNGELLAFPFLGGLDRFLPQFVDIDGDGDLDLFVLRPFAAAQGGRLQGRLTYFENEGNAQDFRYRFVTDFYQGFDAHSWFFYLDFDADGDCDLMLDNGAGGLAYRRNTGSPNRAQFMAITDTITGADGQPVRNEFTSLPAFADIDADGDFDFFSGLSIGTIAFYRNAGNDQTPVFDFETSRWQNLVILSLGMAGLSSFKKAAPQEQRHGANGITFTDLDRDGDQDLFYGDFFHRSVYRLHNSGSPFDPVVAIADTFWPPPQPVQTLGYNVPCFADIDGDGDADFFSAVLNQDRDNFPFYLNLSGPGQPLWQQATHNFLSIIDVGGTATPAFADLDADGDQDLFIGNLDGAIVHYENLGNGRSPSFVWRTDTFQNIRITGFASTPTFADIDHDGDQDLFIGSFFGQIAFYENLGTAQSPRFVQRTAEFENIDVGSASAPHFADGDRDGDLDLYVGETAAGVISVFENIGSAVAPRFQFKSEIHHAMEVTDSKPFLLDWDGDGILDLFVGQRNGRILHYRGVAPAGSDLFAPEQSEFAGIHVGESSAPAFADLNGDARVDLLVGDEAGGLYFFQGQKELGVTAAAQTPATFALSVFPNPFRHEMGITVRLDSRASRAPPRIVVYALTGARVTEITPEPDGGSRWRAQWQPSRTASAAGVYFLQVQWGQAHASRKILLLR